jgi:nucleoid-associated protein YgaU
MSTSSAGGGSPVPAMIEVLSPGSGQVQFSYSPDPYTIKKTSEFHSTSQPAASGGGTPQFQGTQAPNLDVKILCNSFASPALDPVATIQTLETAMVPTQASQSQNDSKPPTVRYSWGTNIIMSEAIITGLSVTYLRFMQGTPVLAEVTVSLQAVPPTVAAQNPTSGALTSRRTHTVIEGDTLASISYSEYGNATRWRALAVTNGIDDPMRIHPGTVLLVPDFAEAEKLA